MSRDTIKDSALALVLALILFFLCLIIFSGFTAITRLYGA